MKYLTSSAKTEGLRPVKGVYRSLSLVQSGESREFVAETGAKGPLQEVNSDHFELSLNSGLKGRNSMDGGGHDTA